LLGEPGQVHQAFSPDDCATRHHGIGLDEIVHYNSALFVRSTPAIAELIFNSCRALQVRRISSVNGASDDGRLVGGCRLGKCVLRFSVRGVFSRDLLYIRGTIVLSFVRSPPATRRNQLVRIAIRQIQICFWIELRHRLSED